jgi:hypothetical protein
MRISYGNRSFLILRKALKGPVSKDGHLLQTVFAAAY